MLISHRMEMKMEKKEEAETNTPFKYMRAYVHWTNICTIKWSKKMKRAQP